MRLYSLSIFCDFDGTISTTDIGFDLFDRFGRQEPHNQALMEGRISTMEYWRQMAASLVEPLTSDRLDTYLRTIPIDPGYAGLLALARREGYPFTIVSDGFDLYIERFLALHDAPLPDALFCNHAELDEEGRMVMSFPHAAEGCTCVSATCKRNVVLARSAPEDLIVYIGDGVSDRCPAEHADIIFAKRSLAAFCNERRLPHYPFATLDDVATQLAKLLERRRLRPRHQAVLLRKRAFEGE